MSIHMKYIFIFILILIFLETFISVYRSIYVYLLLSNFLVALKIMQRSLRM